MRQQLENEARVLVVCLRAVSILHFGSALFASGVRYALETQKPR
jgi:hypothetical protein